MNLNEVSLMKMVYICPRCGYIYCSIENMNCNECGCTMTETKYSSADFCNIHGMENIRQFKNKLYNEYCYSNPLFSSYQFDKRQQAEDKLYAIPQDPSGKRCPKCGNTEFTPVRKKYSLLTGFLTNKVELICNKCGAKIK